MNDTYLTPGHINPELEILGNKQSFCFNKPYSSIAIQNHFQPIVNIPNLLSLDFTNKDLSGFRFQHITNNNETCGSFSLNYFLHADPIGVPLFTASQTDVVFNVAVRGNDPLIANDFTTKSYVDSTIGELPNSIQLQGDVSGIGVLGIPINIVFNKSLNQIPNSGDLNINNYLLKNVSLPLIGTDGVNKHYVDSHTWTTSQITNFTSSVQSFSLSDFQVPTTTLNIGNQIISNLSDPVSASDAVNLLYMQDYVTNHGGTGTVTNITAGTGLSGGTITTNGTIAIADVGITPGSYSWPSGLNINAQGQVIGASSGLQPFTSLIAGTGISISQGGGQANISLQNSGVSQGWYSLPTLYVDTIGRITSISSGSIPIIDINAGTSGTLSSSRMSVININNGTNGQLNISRLQNYPYNSSLYLNGSGGWSTPTTTISIPLYLNTSSATDGIYITNSNSSAYSTGYVVQTNNGYDVQFGFNNLTNEGYVWSSNASYIKFGTNSTKWLDITPNGYIRHFGIANFYKDNGAPFNNNLWIKPREYWLTGLNTSARRGPNDSYPLLFDVGDTEVGGSAIAMHGDFIQLVQSFDDLGIIFTDSDSGGVWYSWQSYIGWDGNLYVSSSKKKKYSIRKKSHKDYLARLNKLNIYSYGLKCRINDEDDDKVKERKYFKNKKLNIGLLSEEVKEVFDNCVDLYKPIEIDKGNSVDFNKVTNKYKPKDETNYISNRNAKKEVLNINYNNLLCYTILAIQELSNKLEKLENRRIK